MTKPRHHVSDFALLQYIEAQTGVEIETLRRTVAWKADAEAAVSTGMSELTCGELRLFVSGGTVCSIARRISDG